MAQDKIGKFVEAINKEAEKRKAQIENETELFIKQEIDKAENEALQESYELIQQKIVSLKQDIGRDLSRRELESRRRIFLRREEIENNVFDEARRRLSEFTKTGEYPALLRRSADKLAERTPEGAIYIFLRPADMQFAELIKNANPRIVIKEDIGIEIGGLKAENSDRTIIFDDTLDSRLQSRRAWFEENSGLTIA
ncbi:MAG TPA: hypothetical protein DEQ02_07735 [Ruminococcaceae bacterium]|nr:hypothetical protein [Oscillospiraceae bacterium]